MGIYILERINLSDHLVIQMTMPSIWRYLHRNSWRSLQ